MKKEKLFLIDGNALCYRAFYAIRELSNSKGQPTNAVYGFITMIKKIISDCNPDLFGIAFDLKGPTFRHEKYEKYKIHRKPMPDELVLQIPIIKEVVRAYNIPIFELQGYEADDVLATLAKKAEEKGLKTWIVTGDKDALQMINDNINVYNPNRPEPFMDAKAVLDKYGIDPKRIVDLLAIMGDASDNVPGVKGIGEKGATDLIKQYEDLEGVYSNIDSIKGKKKEHLINSKENAMLSKELVILDSNVPVDVDFDKLRLSEPNTEKLTVLFKELEFKGLLKSITKVQTPKGKYEMVDSIDKLETLIRGLNDQKEIAVDLEATGVDPLVAEPVGISFSWKKEQGCYVPFNLSGDMTSDVVLEKLKKILEDEKIKKTGHNIKYDRNLLLEQGIELKGISFDTMIASYLLNPSRMSHKLDDVSIEYLDYKKVPIEQLIGKGKNAISMKDVDVQMVSDYSSEDSDIAFRLKELFQKELKEKDLTELFETIEMPLCLVIADMERQGIKIDVDYLGQMSVQMQKKIDNLLKDIYKEAEEEFNVNSPKQLQKILFDNMGLPVIKKTKTGPSTDESVLKELSKHSDFARQILEYRSVAKLKSTYVDALPELINATTGKIHTSFNQTVTQTGRLSSSYPNLQNIPIRTEEGKKIRKAFIPERSSDFLVSADYSQIELRLLAHLSEDEKLIDAFKKDMDIHSFTASLVYDVAIEDVTDEMRYAAKAINFGIVYGMGAFKLSNEINVPVAQADVFIKNYFKRYPSVKGYLDSCVKAAKDHGYVKTMMNRIRYIPEINSANFRMRSFAERIAVNTPLQGTAADIIKIAMNRIHDKLLKMKSKMVLQVHDELVFDVKADELDQIVKIIKKEMENVVSLKVPITVNIKKGKDWMSMKEISL